MTQVVLSAKVRKGSSQNEWLWHIVDIGNSLSQLMASIFLIEFQCKENHQFFFCNGLDFCLHAWEKFASPYTPPDLAEYLYNDQLCVPLLYHTQ